MTFERRTDNRQESHPKPPLHLVPITVEETILFMLKGFGEFPDETRIAMYLDTLEGCSTDEIWRAVKTWMRQPHDRSAKPGELRDMVLTSRGNKPAVQLYEEEWERNRITPEEKQEVIAGLKPKARAFLQEACPWLFR